MTILNEKVVSIITGYKWGWTSDQTIALFGMLIIICMLIFLWWSKAIELGSLIVATLLMGLLIAAAIWRITQPDVPVTQDVKQYAVILDDEYPANKLLQNYNLIEVNGLEYIIQDKIKE